MSKYSNDNFMIEISKCKDPVMFMGLARTLGVKLFEDEELKNPKDFTTIFGEIMEAYSNAPRKIRKELYTIFKKANEAGEIE